MSLYLGDTPICGGIDGQQLNNPFSLLDYKYSEYELSNASWLLSNGQFNSGSVYQSVYDLLLQELNGTSNKLPYRSYVNTVGNVVDTNGVLSGFSASDYAELPEIFDGNAPWERVLKFTTGKVTTNQVIWGNNGDHRGFQVYIRTDGKFTMSGSSNNSTWNLFDVTSTTALTANTTYYLRVIYDGSKYTQEISTDGINYNLEGTANVATPVTTTTIRLGTHGGAPFSGSIDLNESYININGERWWTGRRKIITTTGDYTDEDYRLNTTDTTFRLPIKVKLPNSKGVAGNGTDMNFYNPGYESKSATLQLASSGGGTVWGNWAAALDRGVPARLQQDTTKSGIEVKDDSLIYLYFYVGEVVQDANIIAAGQALTDIADLKNASNFSQTGLSTLSGLGMPSGRYDSLTIGASGATYTAPANGYFVGWCGGTGWLTIEAYDTFGMSFFSNAQSGVSAGRGYLPVKKGIPVKVYHSSLQSLRFYYAEGEENV